MAFATPTDVATRLGRSLTAAESAMAEQVIDDVSGLILEIDGRAEDDIDPTPAYYRALCVAKTLQVGANPSGLASHAESLGAYSETKTFPRSLDGADIFLTEREEQVIRRIAGSVSGSSYPRGMPHEFVTEPS